MCNVRRTRGARGNRPLGEYRRRCMSYVLTLTATVFLLAACSPPGAPASPLPTAPSTDGAPTLLTSPSPTIPAAPSGPTMPPEERLGRVSGLAIEDLATRLRVPAEAIDVISAERVTWPDGSVGCPQPDMAYTQALVEGYRVVLGREGRVYLYHAGSDGQPFMCESNEPDGGYDFVPPPGFER